MRRYIYAALGIALVVFFVSCSQPLVPQDPLVRFQNLIASAEFAYGLRFGNAEYDGVLTYGNSTAYFSTPSGSYQVQSKTSSGSWVTLSSVNYTVEDNHDYTVSISGSYDPTSGTLTSLSIQFSISN